MVCELVAASHAFTKRFSREQAAICRDPRYAALIGPVHGAESATRVAKAAAHKDASYAHGPTDWRYGTASALPAAADEECLREVVALLEGPVKAQLVQLSHLAGVIAAAKQYQAALEQVRAAGPAMHSSSSAPAAMPALAQNCRLPAAPVVVGMPDTSDALSRPSVDASGYSAGAVAGASALAAQAQHQRDAAPGWSTIANSN